MSGSVSPTKAAVVGLLAVDGVEQHALGQAHVAAAEEQVLGQDLAARDAGHVRHDTLHLVDTVLLDRAGQLGIDVDARDCICHGVITNLLDGAYYATFSSICDHK